MCRFASLVFKKTHMLLFRFWEFFFFIILNWYDPIVIVENCSFPYAAAYFLLRQQYFLCAALRVSGSAMIYHSVYITEITKAKIIESKRETHKHTQILEQEFKKKRE